MDDRVAEDVASDPVLRPVSQQTFDRRGLVEDRALGVEEADDVRGVLDQGAEPRLARLERLLGPLALGDVFREPANARDVPVLVLMAKADFGLRGPGRPAAPPGTPASVSTPCVLSSMRSIALSRSSGSMPLVQDAVVRDGLVGSPPDLFEAGAVVDDPIVPGVPDPEDLVDVLRQLTEGSSVSAGRPRPAGARRPRCGAGPGATIRSGR